MKPKKLLALALTLALLLVGTGVFADAQSTGETAQEGSANEQLNMEAEGVSDVLIPAETDAPVPTAEQTVAEATEEPASEPSTTPEETEEPASEVSATPEETEEPASEASATPEESEETAEPETEAEPTAEPEVEESDYAYVPAETILYRDVNRTDKLGQVSVESVMLVYEVASYEGGVLYEAYFDTEESLKTSECEHVYFFSSSPLKRLTDEQFAAFAADEISYRSVEQRAVYTAVVAYAAASEPEEMPTVSHISKSDVNLRSEPSRTSESIATLQKGDLIEATGKVVNAEGETWYAISCKGVSGYVRSDLVTVFEDVPEIGAADEAEPTEEPTAEPTTEPTEEAAQEATTEPTEEPVAEATEEPIAATRSVSIAFSYDTETLELGSKITLTATLEGYEGLDYTCCWQYAAADADGSIAGEWQDAQKDALTYTYELTEENVLTAWRMCVTIND